MAKEVRKHTQNFSSKTEDIGFKTNSWQKKGKFLGCIESIRSKKKNLGTCLYFKKMCLLRVMIIKPTSKLKTNLVCKFFDQNRHPMFFPKRLNLFLTLQGGSPVALQLNFASHPHRTSPSREPPSGLSSFFERKTERGHLQNGGC